MNIEQAFGNLVAACAVAQSSGKLNLDQAAAVVDSIKVVRDALKVSVSPEAAPPADEG